MPNRRKSIRCVNTISTSATLFQIFGYPQSVGVIAATAVQLFCFGTVTILGGIVILSRSGVTIWRVHKSARAPSQSLVIFPSLARRLLSKRHR
jgi:hypothetical protein